MEIVIWGTEMDPYCTSISESVGLGDFGPKGNLTECWEVGLIPFFRTQPV